MSTELQREMQTMDSLVALYGDEGDKADWQRIRASLTPAREAAAAVPEGYKVVPVEPTQGMLDAAGMCIVPDGKEWLDQSNRETWAAMLAAAPAQQPAAAVPAANVTPMRQPRTDLARLVESIKAVVYVNGDGLSVTEAIGALEIAKLELLKEQEQ